MYLKSIEVNGFKSFANKIVFKFNHGITCIVGPNGSGKSNVADAVRWVLGEQSAKSLRGSKMEDVIFSGTQLRKPQGSAYVAITLDNSDHHLPIDYNEVTVARRVYRSGESEYLINGTVSRLKDVNSLFFDTGIGKEGYSIIGQGQIEKILNGKPEERRELFDEAAGIVKFKKNKAAAEKSLEAERDNLSRVNDILYELEKQVGPLQKQSETARKYLLFKDELKKLLAEIVKEHKRVIFNGDGYSDAWVEEAAKRGLPNYKTTADCVPHYADEKNVKLFEKFGIFSKAEIEARVEILLESYSKTINIEALTMIDMAKKKYIPACLAYSKELADAIAVKKSIDVCTCVEKDLVKKVTEETEKAYDAVQKLEEVTAVAAAKTCMQEMANAYRDTVLPVMDDLRKAVDALEVLMPSTMWPVPAYSEMIFNV